MAKVRPRRWFERLFARTAEEPRTVKYHAVSIRCTDNACQAAKDALGERHLSAAAPMLPLDQCDKPDQCDCRYQHYDDRRDGSRRRTDQGLPASTDPDSEDRRSAKDRRAATDGSDAEPFSVHDDSYYEHVGDTIRTAMIDSSESDAFDPYNSGSFDRSKSRKRDSR